MPKIPPTATKAKFVPGTYKGHRGLMLRAQVDVPGADAVFFPEGSVEAINFDDFVPDVPFPDAVTESYRRHGAMLNT